MGLSFAEKAIFYQKQVDFPKIRWKIVQYFTSVHVHKPKFGLFSALLLSLPFSLHVFSGCCKTLGVNYAAQSLEMDLDQL